MIKRLFLAALLAISASVSHAQFVNGQVLTAQQLNNAFANVLALSGGTLTGPLTGTSASFTSATIGSAAIIGGSISGLSTPLPQASGGTGTTTGTGTGSVVLSSSPTIASPTISTGATLNGQLAVTPAASSLTKAFNTSQSLSGATSANCTSTLFAYPCGNLFYISADAADARNPNNVYNDWQFAANFGGSTMYGGRQLFSVIGNFTGASNSGNTNPSYVAFVSQMATNSGDGGTAANLTNGRGSFFASNPIVAADSGATNLFGITGEEVNAVCNGCTTALRFGVSSAASGTNQAAILANDAAFHVGSIQSGGQWHEAFNLSNVNGIAPLDSTGCVICTDSTANTIGTGIDLSAYTITGNFLSGPGGFSVSGAGLVTSANGLTVSGGGATVAGGLIANGGLTVASGTTSVGILTASGALSGSGFTTLLSPYAPLASPTLTGTPTAPTAVASTNTTQLATTAFANAAVTGGGNPGSFTTLAASSTVSGTGFSNYLASPPAIGGTTPGTGKFTTLSTTAQSKVVASTTNAQSIPNNVFTTVTTYTATLNQGSNLTTSTGVYVTPAAGVYDVRAGTRFTAVAGAVGSQALIAVFVNGTEIVQAGMVQQATTAFASQAYGAWLISCNSGDSVTVRVFQNSGSAMTLDGSAAANYLQISQLP